MHNNKLNLLDFMNPTLDLEIKATQPKTKVKKFRVNKGFKRIKNKSYETRTYDYYDKKESLNIICNILAYNGWTIYGFKEDRSDMMTDYYDPARWDGIAVKNGYILVMNNSYSGGTISGNYVLRSYRKDINEQVKKLIQKNEKLLTLAQNTAASDGEKNNAFRMIENNNKKIESFKNEYYIEEDTKNPYPSNLPEVSYQKNPSRTTWHIEKDGKIIDKGTGYYKFCDIDGFKYHFRNECTVLFKNRAYNDSRISSHCKNKKEWKAHYHKLLRDKDKNEARLDDLFTFIEMLESKVKLVLGDGEEEQLVKVVKEVKEIYFTAEPTDEKTEYFTVGEGWRKISGFTQGNIYKIDGEKAYKLTRKMYSSNGKYISSYRPIPNKSTKPDYLISLEEKISEGKLTYVKLVENSIKYEKEEWVKPKQNTKKEKHNLSTKEVESTNYEEILSSGEIKEGVNAKGNTYKYVYIKKNMDLSTFKQVCTYLKDNNLGFYIKGKGFYLNSLNKNVA